MYEITGGIFKVGINPIGAELEYIKINNIDILWQRNDVWNAQSPVLFPNIGCFKDGSYSYQGKKYELEPHGFVKNTLFEVAYLDNNKITLSKTYDKFSLSKYPFKFELLISYMINNNSLNIEFEIINLDDKDITFSIGIHPGFTFEGLNSILGEDYKFKFNEDVKEVFFSPTFVTGIGENTVNYNTFKGMSDDLITKRTICLKGIKEFEIYNTYHKLIFINNMSYMAFWHKKEKLDSKFICIEAWEGLPDMDVKESDDILCKEGNIIIKKMETFKTSFKIIYK